MLAFAVVKAHQVIEGRCPLFVPDLTLHSHVRHLPLSLGHFQLELFYLAAFEHIASVVDLEALTPL